MIKGLLYKSFMGAHAMGGLVSFLRKDPFVKNGILRFGNMRICGEGGCHHGRRDREVVQWQKMIRLHWAERRWRRICSPLCHQHDRIQEPWWRWPGEFWGRTRQPRACGQERYDIVIPWDTIIKGILSLWDEMPFNLTTSLRKIRRKLNLGYWD